MTKQKKCTTCREKKDKSEFYGEASKCKVCAINYAKARNKAVHGSLLAKIDVILERQEKIIQLQQRLEARLTEKVDKLEEELTARVDSIEGAMEKLAKRMKKLTVSSMPK
jgi:hypothetical protein